MTTAVAHSTLDRVGEVWAGNRLDEAALSRWFAASVPGFVAPLTLAQFRGGASNPTFLVTDAAGARTVVRKKPAGPLPPSTHQVEREHRIMAALGDTDVPVPEMLGLCTDAGVIGTEFYAMRFLDGRIFRDNHLPGMTPAERTATYGDCARVLARLHAVDVDAVGLGDLARRGGYYARQFKRWSTQYATTRTRDVPSMEALIARLPALLPTDDPSVLTHGDARMENIMIAADRPAVLALLDWELATFGDRFADLAFFCLFRHAHFMPWGAEVAGTPGIPSEAAFVDAYAAASGHHPGDRWPFYLAFSAFRLAAIAQGAERRVAEGKQAAVGQGSGTQAWADLALDLLDR